MTLAIRWRVSNPSGVFIAFEHSENRIWDTKKIIDCFFFLPTQLQWIIGFISIEKKQKRMEMNWGKLLFYRLQSI